MKSMTGFGQAQAGDGRFEVAVTARSVNSRHLDLVFRLKEEYRAAEAPLRELASGLLSRGRVELAVEIRPVSVGLVEVTVRAAVVRALHRASAELVAEGMVSPTLTLGELLRLPEAVEVRTGENAWDEAAQALLLAVARQALGELNEAREVEGRKLALPLGERIDTLTALVARLDSLRPVVLAEAAENLKRRIASLLGSLPVDEQRLAQEVAVLADRGDVSEEVDRLAAHLQLFRDLMNEPGPVGKRLDFLTQEILRELNTLGAKCRHKEVSPVLLEAKNLAEQLREQVQNLE